MNLQRAKPLAQVAKLISRHDYDLRKWKFCHHLIDVKNANSNLQIINEKSTSG